MPSLLLPLTTSAVEIRCILNSTEPRTFWSVNLGSDSSGFQYRTESIVDRETLADYGVFELPKIEGAGEPLTLRLLINDTARNNQTRVLCASKQPTTLLLFGM